MDIVTPTHVQWAGLPDREEAGSPNVVGAVAMAAAARVLMDAGMDSVERHETALTTYALERLRSLPDITIYGATGDRRTDDRVGVIAFNLGGLHHALVAAILGYEGGIGVRNGCFCAQSYVAHLLELSESDQARWHERASRRRQIQTAGHGAHQFRGLQHLGRRRCPRRHAGADRAERLPGLCTYQVPASGDYRPAGYEEMLPGDFPPARGIVHGNAAAAAHRQGATRQTAETWSPGLSDDNRARGRTDDGPRGVHAFPSPSQSIVYWT